MRRLFGTDGIRGIANKHPMTAEMSVRLGQAVAHHFRHEHRRTRVLVGKDTRLSSYMFESALAAGITSMGADVIFVGPLPTPAIAFLTSSMRADAGIVISASHNAFHDNGLKIFAGDGFKLPDEVELKLESLMLGKRPGDPSPVAALLDPDRIGRARRYEDSKGRYIVFLKASFPKDLRLDGLKIVVDCANGAAYKVAPAALEELGAEVILLGTKPNGTNINSHCGSQHPRFAAAKVLESGADLGITLDGDADRVIMIDERGQLVDGDQIMAVVAPQMQAENRLPRDTVVSTVMTNLGLEAFLAKRDIKLVRTQVGDRYVVEEMRKRGVMLGGEQSGHLIFLDHATTGDGMIAALQILSVMLRTGRRLSELTSGMEAYPQRLINVAVDTKPPIDTLETVTKAIADSEARLGSDGRVLVRYSGTEGLARVMVEGLDGPLIDECAQTIVAAVTGAIGSKA